jgi:hypothetical protein
MDVHLTLGVHAQRLALIVPNAMVEYRSADRARSSLRSASVL